MTDSDAPPLHEEIAGIASTTEISSNQQLFLRYFTAILIDLVVLNLFAEFWTRVEISAFSVSLLAAVMLQVLLKLSLAIEHQVAQFFLRREGTIYKVLRWISAWAVLFISKLVILWALHFTLGERLVFAGPNHGVLAFIVVVVTILAAEEMMIRLYRRLA